MINNVRKDITSKRYPFAIDDCIYSDTPEGRENIYYKTIDGFTGYKINCPICQTNKGLLNTRIFPKEMKNGRLQWFYNCNGRASCKCNGINTFQYFYTNYLGF